MPFSRLDTQCIHHFLAILPFKQWKSVYNNLVIMHQSMISKFHQSKYQIFLLIISLSFPLWIGFLIGIFSVNVPYWDEWITPGNLIEKMYSNSGNLSFSDFIEQHNESRLVFPKLIFLAIAYFTHWDVRSGMLLSLLMAFLVSLNLFFISSKTVPIRQGQGEIQALLLAIISNMLIFSPAQYENWLWGIQIVYFIPILCLTTGISIWYSNIKIYWKIIFTIILSTISTFSYANGLLCWFLLPLNAIVLGQWHVLKGHVKLITFWVVVCASNLILYFWNYLKPPHHPSLFEGLFHPLKALNYFFAFLGSPLAGENLIIASTVGFLVVLLAVTLGIFLLKRWGSESLRYHSAGWSTLLIYAIISAIVTTSGRMGFGVEQALTSRYTTFSIYGIIGLLGLSTIVSNEIQARADRTVVVPYWSYKFPLKRTIHYLPSLLAIALIIMHTSVQSTYINAMDLMHRDRLYSKVCLIYADFVEDRCFTQSSRNLPSLFKRNLNAARALGILKQEDFAQNARLPSAQNTSSDTYKYGWIDGVKQVRENDFLASGWAILENPGRTADAVLLSYQDDQGKSRMFTVAPVKLDRPDVSKVKQNSIYTRSGWAINFSRSSLPNRKVQIDAWAYDIKTKSIYPLNGSHSLR